MVNDPQQDHYAAGELLHFEPVHASSADLPYADLATIDVSTFADGASAQRALAEQVREAMHGDGFFTLVGMGISEAEIARHVDIAYTVLERTPLEEKKRLRARMQEDGCYKGFKPRQYYEFGDGVKDQIEQFNWSRDMSHADEFPSAMHPFLDEVRAFTDKVHNHVLLNLLRLFALALELPPETFVDKHKFDVHDESWFRYMAYYDAHSKEDEAKTKGVWLKGHQDFGTCTFVFSQPMASLQVRGDDGAWRFVRHTPGGIVVNCGVMMEWYTGGYFKAANHRVAAPPDDQRGHTRCGVLYFSVPNDEERPNTLMESPVLQRAGVQKMFEDGKGLSSKVYSQARIARVGKSETYKRQWGDGEVVVEMIAGVEVPWYG